MTTVRHPERPRLRRGEGGVASLHGLLAKVHDQGLPLLGERGVLAPNETVVLVAAVDGLLLHRGLVPARPPGPWRPSCVGLSVRHGREEHG